MVILGASFLGADGSFAPTPTNVDKINTIAISNGVFDSLYAGSNINIPETFDIKTEWDVDTIMAASYDVTLDAGSADYVLDNTSDIIIKRRVKGTYDWVTVYNKHINTPDDFNIGFADLYTANGKTYEYACVGVLNNIEGTYNIIEVESKFNGMFIADKENIYGTFLDIGTCDTTRTHYTNKLEIPNYKYPVTYNTSDTNYDTGTSSGYFLKYNLEKCELYPEDSVDYRKEFIDFLTDNKPKILKSIDGRIWMISVDGQPTDSEDGHYLHRIISFSWFECGDCNLERDLYDSGLSDVPYEFWSKV